MRRLETRPTHHPPTQPPSDGMPGLLGQPEGSHEEGGRTPPARTPAVQPRAEGAPQTPAAPVRDLVSCERECTGGDRPSPREPLARAARQQQQRQQ